MKSCFDSCLNYIKKRNIVPNKNLLNLMNENIMKENEIKIDNNIIQDELNFKITVDNLYICYNFSFFEFYKEEYIIKRINEEGKGYFNIYNNEKCDVVAPKIKYDINENEYIDCMFICQKDLYKIINMEYNDYIKHMDLNDLNKNNILVACMNILIFIRSNKNFQESNQFLKILENIFYILLKCK